MTTERNPWHRSADRDDTVIALSLPARPASPDVGVELGSATTETRGLVAWRVFAALELASPDIVLHASCLAAVDNFLNGYFPISFRKGPTVQVSFEVPDSTVTSQELAGALLDGVLNLVPSSSVASVELSRIVRPGPDSGATRSGPDLARA